MLPEITKKTIHIVTFPVYKLLSDELTYYDKVTYCQDKIVDDRTQIGETLGQRRLHIPKEKLYPLNYTAIDFLSMIKANYRHFIDTKGRAFSYRKTKASKIRSFKIKNVKYYDHFTKMEVRGLSKAFYLPRPPPAGYPWANIMFIDNFPWEVLSFSEEKQPEIRRFI